MMVTWVYIDGAYKGTLLNGQKTAISPAQFSALSAAGLLYGIKSISDLIAKLEVAFTQPPAPIDEAPPLAVPIVGIQLIGEPAPRASAGAWLKWVIVGFLGLQVLKGRR